MGEGAGKAQKSDERGSTRRMSKPELHVTNTWLFRRASTGCNGGGEARGTAWRGVGNGEGRVAQCGAVRRMARGRVARRGAAWGMARERVVQCGSPDEVAFFWPITIYGKARWEMFPN